MADLTAADAAKLAAARAALALLDSPTCCRQWTASYPDAFDRRITTYGTCDLPARHDGPCGPAVAPGMVLGKHLRASLEAVSRLEAERDALRRGDAECIDDDGDPFASARSWRSDYYVVARERDAALARERELRADSLVYSVRNAILAAGAPLTGKDGAPASWGWRVRWVCDRLSEARAEVASVHEALDNGADERVWPPGQTVAEAIEGLLVAIDRLEFERDEARGALVRLTWEASPQGVDPATVPAHWTWVVTFDDPPAGQWERPGAVAGKLTRGGAFWASNVVGRGQCATVAEAIGVVDYALGVPVRP